eukprot:2866814-Alexandrium_andersonii.AAC.1
MSPSANACASALARARCMREQASALANAATHACACASGFPGVQERLPVAGSSPRCMINQLEASVWARAQANAARWA